MTNKKFERFGKYLILDHLVDGGMAKICRARYLGEQANKIVAIKMVQQQFSKDPSFVQMFEDEINVTFGLLHPNIAQVYDYGMVNSQLFTAMEYVDGANLKQYLDRLKERKCVFPEEISVYIISQVCQALHYAHTFTDKLTGKPFNIIHRDISPHNIMLTYDGAVKVIDFGIAKADSNSEATQAGTIKGKLSYLAPEYLDGLDLDSRYDEFAVGITLWEMLTGRKLFKANNDLAVLKQIQACKIPPPSKFNPHVPKELDAIVLKALSKDRNSRYEDMDKFNRALVKFLYQNYPDFNSTDLNSFSEQLFAEEISTDRKKFVQYGKIDIKPYLIELKGDKENSQSSSNTTVEENGITKSKIVLDFGDSDNMGLEDSIQLDLKERTNQIKTKSQGTTKKVARRQVGRTSAGSPSRSATRSRRVSSATKAGRTRKTTIKQSTPKKGNNALYGVVASIFIFGFVYMQKDTISDAIGVGIKKTSTIDRTAASVSPKKKSSKGSITFSNYDFDMEIYVNGQKRELDGIGLKVSLHRKHSITVIKSGFKKYVHTPVRLSESDREITIDIPELEKESIGLLSTSRNFTSGSKIIFSINGEKIERDLPVNNFRVPAGTYKGIIANPLLGTERKIKFVIEENKKLFLE
jgi:serine/threonine-protein kinase